MLFFSFQIQPHHDSGSEAEVFTARNFSASHTLGKFIRQNSKEAAA